jgi:hypothetical protein
VVLFLAAILAALVGLAHWNRKRELEGPGQHSRLAVILNLVIAVVAWQVIRQPLWRDSLAGMMQLPKVYENRMALEAGFYEWTQVIQNGGSAAPTDAGATAPAPRLGRLPAPPVVLAPVRITMPPGGHRGLAALAAMNLDQPDAPAQTRTRARFLRETGSHGEAADLLEPLARSAVGTDEDARDCLRALVDSGQIDRARNLAASLVVRDPTRELKRWLACLDAEIGEMDKALSSLRQLARRKPFDPADAYILGELALMAGRPRDALDAVARLESAGERTERTRLLAARAQAPRVAGGPARATDLLTQ